MPTSADQERLAGRIDPGEHWSVLLRVAAVAALLSAVCIPVQVAVFLAWPPPLDGTTVDWFTLLREQRLAGLVDLDLLLVVDNVLLIPVLLALAVALRSTSRSVVLLAVALGMTSVLMYLATNPAVQMAGLSEQYAAAATDADRAAITAAGAAALATWQGTAFHTAYLLGSVAGILLGVVMLRGGVFSRPAAVLAIAANSVGLGLYVPGIGVYIAVFSVVFLEVWYVLIGWRLLQLGRAGAPLPGASGPRGRRSTPAPSGASRSISGRHGALRRDRAAPVAVHGSEAGPAAIRSARRVTARQFGDVEGVLGGVLRRDRGHARVVGGPIEAAVHQSPGCLALATGQPGVDRNGLWRAQSALRGQGNDGREAVDAYNDAEDDECCRHVAHLRCI